MGTELVPRTLGGGESRRTRAGKDGTGFGLKGPGRWGGTNRALLALGLRLATWTRAALPGNRGGGARARRHRAAPRPAPPRHAPPRPTLFPPTLLPRASRRDWVAECSNPPGTVGVLLGVGGPDGLVV